MSFIAETTTTTTTTIPPTTCKSTSWEFLWYIKIFTIAFSCSVLDSGSLGNFTGNPNTSWTPISYTYTATKLDPIFIIGVAASTSFFILLDDMSIVSTASPSVQLLNNPGFENTTTNITGWQHWCGSTCTSGAQGIITNIGCHTGTYCYKSQCGTGRDYIAQQFPSVINQTYNITFWYQRVKLAGGFPITFYVGII